MKNVTIELPFQFNTQLYFICAYNDGYYRLRKSTKWYYEIYKEDDIRINFDNQTFYLDSGKIYTKFEDARQALKSLNGSSED